MGATAGSRHPGNYVKAELMALPRDQDLGCSHQMLGSPGKILKDSFQWAQSGVPSPHPGSFCHPKILPADAQGP